MLTGGGKLAVARFIYTFVKHFYSPTSQRCTLRIGQTMVEILVEWICLKENINIKNSLFIMKKYLSFAAFALLASAMTFSLSACGGDDDDDNGTNNGGQTEKPLTPEGAAAVAVDLGLPSGTKWATYNLGAARPEDYGLYFAWGETLSKADFTWSTYKWGAAADQLTRYCNDSEKGKDGYTDAANPEIGKELTELLPEDDVAYAKWGGTWRMPTRAQFEELIANTNNAWVGDYNGTGISGYKFTNKNDASKFIFLPAAGGRNGTSSDDVGSRGYYWSSSLYTSYPTGAYYLYVGSGDVDLGSYRRYGGHSVRPVRAQ